LDRQLVRPLFKESDMENENKLNKALDSGKEAARNLLGENVAEPPATEAPKEDAFIIPERKVKHAGPPTDPDAPSGSLSSDEAEAIAVDFSNPANPGPR
jgi:hypothetical protein